MSENKVVRYVDPYIGSIGYLLTSTTPIVSLPHGMMKVAPITTPGVADRYLAQRIFGFPAGCASLMPLPGAGQSASTPASSSFDHDLETATPYYYSVLLEDTDIAAEYTVSYQSAFYRYTYPQDEVPLINVGLPQDAVYEVEDNSGLRIFAAVNGVPHYVYMVFSLPILTCSAWQEQEHAGVTVTFDGTASSIVEVQVGLSYISVEQARRNWERELRGRAFEQTKQAACEAWNEALGRMKLTGGTEEQRKVFYTALYRSQLNMSNITEEGRYYSAFDGCIHEEEGFDFYVRDQMWDTYRCLHPLQLLLEPRRQEQMISSYLRMYEQCGWLPQFPYLQGDLPIMTGNHTAAMILDTYRKGSRGFDVQLAYEAMKKNAMDVTMLPWVNGPLTELDEVYRDKGYFPALAKGQTEWVQQVDGFERRQAVAVTLEHAYDDWCIAQMAKALGHSEDYNYFIARSYNYRHLYDERIGFMAPRDADGQWVEDFDPKLGGGLGGRDYFSECNSWIYTFHVQHDIDGLRELMGGTKKFEQRLDELFSEQYSGSKYEFLARFPDSTGLIGQYCQGNEPAFHIPYLYNYAGAPWKTQRRVREIMEIWYSAGPHGLCGDEDNGAMSSWYVLSAIGLYPVCPGKPVYDIGSPLFERVRLRQQDGKVFTIEANQVSERNKYIQSAMLNGKPLNVPRIHHADVAAGGKLTLEMGDRPNKSWGLGVD